MKNSFAKILSLVLALIMLISVVPSAALARNVGTGETNVLTGWFDWWRDFLNPRPRPNPGYPAQSLEAKPVNGVSVNAEIPVGSLPAGTTLDVAGVNDIASFQHVCDELNFPGHILTAVDISFMSNGEEVEPRRPVTITMSSDALIDAENVQIIHFPCDANGIANMDGRPEVITDYYLSGNTISFDADQFSVYAVSGGSSSGGNLLTVEFYAKDTDGVWQKINAQAIRMSKIASMDAPVFDPGVPTITTGQSFEGWAETQAEAEADDTVGISVAEINSEIKNSGYDANSESKTLKFYAMVFNVRYVVYHDQAGAVMMTQAYHVHGNNPESVEIDWSYVGFKGGQNFAGWVEESAIATNTQGDLLLGDYPLYKDNVGQVYENGEAYSLNKTLQLYPYLNTGHWLTFDNNLSKNNTLNDFDDSTSASYTSPVFVAENVNTAAPATPTRTGYTFGGWFKDENLTQRFVFGSPLNEDTTVYAKWTPASTTYRIAVWQQISTDAVDEDNMNNVYAYYTPTTVDVVLTAHTGDQVSVAEAYKLLGNQNDSDEDWGEMGYYFVYNDARTNAENDVSTQVKGDGSTVLNVYYDRKLITIHFWTSSSMSTHYSISGSAYVPAENGQYYYYENPNPTGYYLCGTGPSTSSHPRTGSGRSVSGYYWGWASQSGTSHTGYSSLNGNSPATYLSTDSDQVIAYGSSETATVSLSNEGYYYEQYSSSSYFPIYYKYTSTSSYTTGYYQVGTGPNPNAAGTHNLTAVTNPMIGLYQAPLVGWPADPSGYEWEYDDVEDTKHYGITYRDCYDIPDNTHTTTWNIYAASVSGTINSTIHWMCEKLDGSFEEITTNKIKTTTTQYYDHGKFLGFMALGHNLTTNSTSTSNGFVAYQKNVGITGSDFGSNGAYIFYVRRTYDFNYISNNDTVKTEQNVKYQQDISGFASYIPTNGHEGYYFDGWYADPGCTQEFDFNTTMPNNEVTIYAKWTMERFRVVCDPTGGENIPASDIVFPGNQATTFRVDYGELVQGSSLNNAQRDGYTLLGWFLDPEYTIPFNFGQPITDEIADMSYATASEAERQGTDPWNSEDPTYSDVGRANVRGKVVIYAQWRKNPDGIIGINVHYDATDKDGNTGKFSDNSTEWDDPNIYADKAKAFGQPASAPDDNGLQFLYWEILDANNNNAVVGKAYPGQLWTVNVDWAKVTDLTAKAVYTAKDDIKIIDNPGASTKAPKRSGTRATETYVAVTQPTPGKKYLITYTRSAGDYAWLMSTTSFQGTSISDYGVTVNNRPNGVRVTVSNGTITGDYNDYLYGVEYYNGRYRIGNIYSHQYISLFPDPYDYGYHYIVEGAFTNYTNYVYWTLNTSTKTLQNYGDSSYYMYMDGSSSSGYYFTGNTSGDPITFYELVEEEVTDGTVFYRIDELRVGDKVVIAHENKAIGNTTVSSDRFVDAVTVTHTVTGDESITVPNDKVSTVQWEVVSGDSTNGFVLKNVSNGKYLAIDGGEYLTVGTSQSTLWKYSGTDLTNNGSNYQYLKFNNEYVNFDTSSASGQDIRIYAASRKYNVTFIDGSNNTQIGEVQQVEEGGSALAPEPPDHSAQGLVFTGWSAPYDNITEDTIVTAQYTNVSDLSYTVTFHYRLSDGSWHDESQTVQHGHAATPPDAASVAPAGYTFNSWDKKYDNITSNLTINAVYKQTATKKYEITLRAVYGRANTTAKTHIYWFANNDVSGATGGDVQRDLELDINEAINIPTPSNFRIYTGSKAGENTLTYEDHIFLGWARIDNETGTNPEGVAHPELNEDDLFLKWDPETGKYIVAKKLDNIDDVAIGEKVTQVAADETHPYHDMYAVWATVFYVYHSGGNGEGGNTVEKVVMTSTKFVDGERVPNKYDIAHATADGFLYGGYYKAYEGTSTGWVNAKESIDWTASKNQASWNSDGTLNYDAMMETKTDADATAYTGGNVAWNIGDAYLVTRDGENAENGLAITPKAGTTYYLKEVPADKYLMPYLHYTYRLGYNNITAAWVVSDIDDLNYYEGGFVIVSTDNKATVVRTLSIVNGNGGHTETLSAQDTFGTPGYLSYLKVIEYSDPASQNQLINLLQDNYSVKQYWVTPDGLLVTGTLMRTYNGVANTTSITGPNTEITSEIRVWTPAGN